MAIQSPSFQQEDLPTLSSFGKAGWIAALPSSYAKASEDRSVARNDAVGQFIHGLVSYKQAAPKERDESGKPM